MDGEIDLSMFDWRIAAKARDWDAGYEEHSRKLKAARTAEAASRAAAWLASVKEERRTKRRAARKARWGRARWAMRFMN